MNIRTLLLVALCLTILPATAHAQERGQVGVTMGFPAAAGLIWHATSRIAVRPEITFVQITSKADLPLPNFSTESTERSVGFGGSVLWYFRSSDANVRPYISPRVIYTRTTREDNTPTPGDDEDPAGTLTVTGSFGAQYTPARRFGLFGEVGFGRTHSERTRTFQTITGNLTLTTSVTSWSTRGAVGVILYLGG